MKRISRRVLATLLLLWTVLAGAETIELEVNGLVCAFCAQGIEKKLRKLPATEDVFVSLEHRMVAIALKDGVPVENEKILESITEAGYTTVNLSRSDRSLKEIRKSVEEAER